VASEHSDLPVLASERSGTASKRDAMTGIVLYLKQLLEKASHFAPQYVKHVDIE
jgi:hypothetical protein